MEMNKNATNSVKLRELLEEKEAAEMLLWKKWIVGNIWKS